MRRKPAEVLFLFLPVVLLCAFGWWLRNKPQTPRETGMLQLHVGSWRPSAIRPSEAFLGKNVSIEASCELRGMLPANAGAIGEPFLFYAYVDGNLVLRQGERWIPWNKTRPDEKWDITARAEGAKIRPVFKFPDKAPHGDEIRLRGRVYEQWIVEIDKSTPPPLPKSLRLFRVLVEKRGKRFFLQGLTKPAPFETTLWRAGESWPRPNVGRERGFEITEWGPRRYADVDHEIKERRARTVFWNVDFEAKEDLKKMLPYAEYTPCLKTEVLDAKGRVLDNSQDRLASASFAPDSLGSETSTSKGQFSVSYHDDLLPPGDVRVRAYVAANYAWPTVITQVIRPAWEAKASQLLKFERISSTTTTVKVSGQTFSSPAADIRISYHGHKKLTAFGVDLSRIPTPIQTVSPDADKSTRLDDEWDDLVVRLAGEGIQWYSNDGLHATAPHPTEVERMDDGSIRLIYRVDEANANFPPHPLIGLDAAIVGDGVLKIRQPLTREFLGR